MSKKKQESSGEEKKPKTTKPKPIADTLPEEEIVVGVATPAVVLDKPWWVDPLIWQGLSEEGKQELCNRS